MGKFGIMRDHDHKERVLNKREALKDLDALYDEWLPFKEEHDPYMVHLRHRRKVIENQLKNMRP